MKNINPNKSSWLLYKRLLRYVVVYWPILLLGVVANIVYTSIDAGLTYMVKTFFEKSFIHVDVAFIQKLPWILLLAVTFRGLMGGVGGYCMTAVARSVVKVLRQAVFSHILQLPAAYYDEATSGQLLSKILYDVEQVAQVSADALTDFIQNFFLTAGLLIVMFTLCWQLSLLFMVTVPFTGVIVNLTNKRVRRLGHRGQQAMGSVTEVATEAIDGYKVIRLFQGQKYETKKFNAATELSRKNDMKVAMSKSFNVLGVQVIIALGMMLIIFASLQLSKAISISPGSFIAIIAAMIQLLKPLKVLTTLTSVFQRGLAGAESVFAVLDAPIETSKGHTLSRDLIGEIRFNNVSFAYRANEPVLQNVSFSLPANKIVALVGQSGSGKSTIASLLARFYDIHEGSITLDGVDIREFSLKSLRQQLALVSQHVTLFNDTIANNIAYGSWESRREDIIQAARLAFADEFIQRLPDGYDTLIGENGALLSGGQRQRIAIARAILKDAPLLILDEATSALDTESEWFIQQALDRVMRHRTTLVIAHRLSTIQSADLIVVLHQGKVVEKGDHDTLLALQGYYARLYHSQFQEIVRIDEKLDSASLV